MLKKLIVSDNPLEPNSYIEYECEDVCKKIRELYSQFPSTARIYKETVCEENDITPKNENDVADLEKINGIVWLIVFPADPLTIIAAVVAVVSVVTSVVTALIAKKPKNNNQQATATNNQLAARSNEQRLGSRIPDIFGEVRSTPDLVSQPYTVYENNKAAEIALMCIGRGTFQVSDIKDDTTLVKNIAGESVEIYGPGTNPSNGGIPQQSVGTPINEKIKTAYRQTSVDGITLRAPNNNTVTGSSSIRFIYPDSIQIQNSGTENISFSDYFYENDIISITNAVFTGGIVATAINVSDNIRASSSGYFELKNTSTSSIQVNSKITISGTYFVFDSGSNAISLDGSYIVKSVSGNKIYLQSPSDVNNSWQLMTATNFASGLTQYSSNAISITSETTQSVDLSGTYTVISVSDNEIGLSNPSSINSDWTNLAGFENECTDYISPTLATSGNKYIGPFVVGVGDTNEILCNIVAASGLYKDNGKNKYAVQVDVSVGITPCDQNGNLIGAESVFYTSLIGSANSVDQVASSVFCPINNSGYFSVRVWRTSETDKKFSGTVVDEVKWIDLYGMTQQPSTIDFGDVTLVQSKTFATTGATSIKDRKLNMLVNRLIYTVVAANPSYISDTLSYSSNIHDVICHMTLDSSIGNRNANSLDLDNLVSVYFQIIDYFGTDLMSRFNYTFGDSNTSYEEMINAVCDVCGCTAYRIGSKLKLSFEEKTQDSVLLFNHRNKIPQSETRTVRFGYDNNNDGIDFTYIDPTDESRVTLTLPTDGSANNPLKYDSEGVRDRRQAWVLAWRMMNKLLYQFISVEFEATAESNLLINGNRILVVDNTRSNIFDGEIVSQAGLNITLSQPIGYFKPKTMTIYMQMYDGSVASSLISPGARNDQVVLNSTPPLSLIVDGDNYARTTYMIVDGSNDGSFQPFLVTEKEPSESFCNKITAVSYDDRFYSNDLDIYNGVIE